MAAPAGGADPDAILTSDDLRPVPPASRTMSGWGMAGLWVAMVVNVPGFYLAGGLVDAGMSWWQGVATVVAGNAIVLLPLLLTAHPGTRYGIPFAVLLRSAFGVRGAHAPAVLRALVSCGWCGIESWIGGQAITLLLPLDSSYFWYARRLPWLGTSVIEFLSFLLFLVAQLGILSNGMRAIRSLQKYSAPLLAVLTAWLFGWAYIKAGGFGEMLATPSRLTPTTFWPVLLSSLTASISSWATLALNIPDFSRYARSQNSQILGQIGLPIFMGLYTFAGLAIASSTETIFGSIISDPIQLLRRINGGAAVTFLSIFAITLATLTTNIPANLVGATNVLVGISPSTFNFSTGALLTSLVSIVFQPWRVMGTSEGFVYTWLVGCSAVLGPIAGIVLADYYIVRRMVLDVGGLYSVNPLGPYYYCGGYNVAAFVALVVAAAPAVPGFLHKVGVGGAPAAAFVVIYDNAWFFGIFSAALVYIILYCWRGRGTVAAVLLDRLSPCI